MMGIGQVVTLRVPGHRLREVNLSIEKSAWGSFRTEYYPTYGFTPVFDANKSRQSEPYICQVTFGSGPCEPRFKFFYLGVM